MHTAFRRETGARTTVLMVHGIMGSPDQFRFLADAIESRNADLSGGAVSENAPAADSSGGKRAVLRNFRTDGHSQNG